MEHSCLESAWSLKDCDDISVRSRVKVDSHLKKHLFLLLYRTIKKEDDVLEMDHQEQTYTITGAAGDSDAE